MDPADDPPLTKPTIGIAGFCAREASGAAITLPATLPMNLRRFMTQITV